MSTPLPHQLLSLGQLLSVSWKKYIEHFVHIALIVVIVYLPVNYIMSIIPEPTSAAEFADSVRLSSAISGLFSIIAFAAIAFLIKTSLEDKSGSLAGAFKFALGKWWKLFSTHFVTNLFVGLLAILLIIPGVIFGIYWLFVGQAVIFNDLSGQSARDFSKHLVRGRWWKVFGYGCVFLLLQLIFLIAYVIISSNLPQTVLFNIATSALYDILSAYITVVLIMFYLNLVNTKESMEAAAVSVPTPDSMPALIPVPVPSQTPNSPKQADNKPLS